MLPSHTIPVNESWLGKYSPPRAIEPDTRAGVERLDGGQVVGDHRQRGESPAAGGRGPGSWWRRPGGPPAPARSGRARSGQGLPSRAWRWPAGSGHCFRRGWRAEGWRRRGSCAGRRAVPVRPDRGEWSSDSRRTASPGRGRRSAALASTMAAICSRRSSGASPARTRSAAFGSAMATNSPFASPSSSGIAGHITRCSVIASYHSEQEETSTN